MNISRLALVVSPSLLIAVGAAAQRLAEIEPNNTLATAMPAPFGAQIDASLTPGDHDWYSITVAATSSVKLFTSPLTSSPVDTVLTLFNAAGVVIDEDDNQRGIYSDITLGLAPGSYLVRVVVRNAMAAALVAASGLLGTVAAQGPAPAEGLANVERRLASGEFAGARADLTLVADAMTAPTRAAVPEDAPLLQQIGRAHV